MDIFIKRFPGYAMLNLACHRLQLHLFVSFSFDPPTLFELSSDASAALAVDLRLYLELLAVIEHEEISTLFVDRTIVDPFAVNISLSARIRKPSLVDLPYAIDVGICPCATAEFQCLRFISFIIFPLIFRSGGCKCQ